MWGSTGVGILHVFVTPLPNKGTYYGTHDAQEEAEKQHDIDAHRNKRRFEGLVGRVGRRCGLGGV